MMSECQSTYPYISFEFLREFCANTGLVEAEKLDALILKVPEEPRTLDTNMKERETRSVIPDQINKINRGLFLRFVVWACKNSEFGIQRCSEFIRQKIKPLIAESKLKQLRTELAKDQEIQQLLSLNKDKIHMFLENKKTQHGLSLE